MKNVLIQNKPSINIKKKIMSVLVAIQLVLVLLVGRIFYIQAFEADFLQGKAFEQHTRDRLITPKRGNIYDRNMVGIAVTETVASVSVIRSQIKDSEQVAKILAEKLELDYETVLTKVNKRVALERIKTKVDKKIADEIRAMDLPGVIIDDDVLRVYPKNDLAAQVIGFVGKDNQGIVGLEAKYDSILKGEQGKILTETDAKGIELDGGLIAREEPIPGQNLVTSIDTVMQEYAQQTIKKAVEAKGAKRGLIVLMNPQNGEILAMANEPTFDLNDPFTINNDELSSIWDTFTDKEKMDSLNQMWRNFAINDTYEPGSTFKIITSAAGIEEGIVTDESTYNCNGGKEVGGRFIKCWRSPRSHGTLNFVEGVQNSCNPVFMDIAEDLGADTFYRYMELFGFKSKTGVDLPGEAVGIMHKLDNVGPVELATMSFGQSFQITPLQLLKAVSATVNGGKMVIPHVGTKIVDDNGKLIENINYSDGEQIISPETSEKLKSTLESVVELGTGNRSYIAGYRIGGKTATSEKLPRRSGKYIASFLTIAPAENPQLIALVLIDEPQGAYYGGQVAGPVMKEVLENVLPYMDIDPQYKEAELLMEGVAPVQIPNFIGLKASEAKKLGKELNLEVEIQGEGELIIEQFPLQDEEVNQGSKVILVIE